MKVVVLVVVLLVLVGFVILAQWPDKRVDARRGSRLDDMTDTNTDGIIPGSGGEPLDYGHHSDSGSGHDHGDSGGGH